MLVDIDKKTYGIVVGSISGVSLFLAIIVKQCILYQGAIFLTSLYLLTGDRPSSVYAIIISLPRDIRAALGFFQMNIILKLWERDKKTVAKVFQDIVKKHPDKVALVMDNMKLTFQDVEDLSNQFAIYFKRNNYQRGDTIALLMDNRPEYLSIWLGLSKVGIITALINTNLRKGTLIHSIKVANSKAIIVTSTLANAITEISDDEVIKNIKVYHYHDTKHDGHTFNLLPNAVDLYVQIKAQPKDAPIEDMNLGLFKDKMVYIYTSGTTGMPKAAVITNMRYLFMALGCHLFLGIRKDDIIYNALPLYHTAGGIIGLGNVVVRGSSMALRKKFSASNFWPDCIKYNCTVAQYIGEICRYLLSVPSGPNDTKHNVRLMFGNGLRPQIWKQFVGRFNIENIGEVYGSTEGNSNLINIDNTIGAVGFVPKFAKRLYPVTLIRCVEETGEPVRNSSGRCERCNPGEPGIFVGKINAKKAVISFEGYADKSASEKKILRDVFKPGDAYFNSGDILVQDLLGYFYFKDRTGDTFRWRGENVSTAEVESVISNIATLHDCVVYGVEIPNVEGKAGMAAIVDPDEKIDLINLSAGIKGSLPPFACPLFIRLLKEMPMTGTFKLKKVDLQNEGYDMRKLKDHVYFLHNDGVYRNFTEKDYEDLINGKIRL